METVFPPITEKDIEEIKVANSGLKLTLIELDLDDGRKFEAVLREPSNAIASRYVSEVSNSAKGKDGFRHHDAFVMDCIIRPNREQYLTLLSELPALSLGVAPKLIEGHGLANDSRKRPL